MLQTTCEAIELTIGIGLTVSTKDIGVPEQEKPAFEALGVTEMVPEIGAVPAFVAEKAGILPVAPVPKPMF